MHEFDNHINGYLDIDNDHFFFNFSDRIVTLLPADGNPKKQKEICRRLRNREFDESEYIIGSYDGFEFAFLKTTDFYYDRFGVNLENRFSPPIIIKSGGNSYGYFHNLVMPWRKFHAISFFRGNINSIYDPAFSVKRIKMDENDLANGFFDIQSRPWSEYTHNIAVQINGKKANLCITIYYSSDKYEIDKMGAYSLGERNSCIRIEFEEEQDINIIPHCYDIIKNFVSVLTKQNNVTFEVRLYQRLENNKLLPHAVCRIFDSYKDYSTKGCNNVIPVMSIFDYIPQLFKAIEKGEAKQLLTLLPDNNHDVDRVYITNIQDLCASLEKAYEWECKSGKKDQLVSDLKEYIHKAIDEFGKKHLGEIDINKQTTIHSCFNYLNFTLKEKIFTLYSNHKIIVDEVSEKWGLPNLTLETIGAFVRIRNKKAHEGLFEWGNEQNIYYPLFALYYICFLEKVGLPDDVIEPSILRIF